MELDIFLVLFQSISQYFVYNSQSLAHLNRAKRNQQEMFSNTMYVIRQSSLKNKKPSLQKQTISKNRLGLGISLSTFHFLAIDYSKAECIVLWFVDVHLRPQFRAKPIIYLTCLWTINDNIVSDIGVLEDERTLFKICAQSLLTNKMSKDRQAWLNPSLAMTGAIDEAVAQTFVIDQGNFHLKIWYTHAEK